MKFESMRIHTVLTILTMAWLSSVATALNCPTVAPLMMDSQNVCRNGSATHTYSQEMATDYALHAAKMYAMERLGELREHCMDVQHGYVAIYDDVGVTSIPNCTTSSNGVTCTAGSCHEYICCTVAGTDPLPDPNTPIDTSTTNGGIVLPESPVTSLPNGTHYTVSVQGQGMISVSRVWYNGYWGAFNDGASCNDAYQQALSMINNDKQMKASMCQSYLQMYEGVAINPPISWYDYPAGQCVIAEYTTGGGGMIPPYGTTYRTYTYQLTQSGMCGIFF